MEIEEIKRRFRRIGLDSYPALRGMSRDDIYRGKMGPGGLLFASQLCERLLLRKGMRLLDVGCGRGATSIFMARNYGAIVYAIDLWIPATKIFDEVRIAGCEDSVLPLNLDVTAPLPFADAYLDALFCMDAFHYFGANDGFLEHIARYLKPGGEIAIGNPCFDREFEGAPPPVYEACWPDEFLKYHSPSWWGTLALSCPVLTEVRVEEARDGTLLWEDDLLYDLEKGNDRQGRIKADADEIMFGRDNPEFPYLTHYILTARKTTTKATRGLISKSATTC